MADTKEPPDFGSFILDADSGRINRILSSDLGRVIETITDKASLHDAEWKGEISLKIKMTAEPGGKLVFAFNKTVKIDEEKMPKARMFYDPDSGAIVTDEPKQLKIKGIDDRKPSKSAKAPQE